MSHLSKETMRRFVLFSLLVTVLVASCSPQATTTSMVSSTALPSATATVTQTIPTPTPTITPANHFESGLDYQQADNLELAIDAFSQAIDHDPQYVDAYFERGRTYAIQGNFDLAITDWSQVIDLDPNYFDAYLFRAFGHDDSGDYEKAIADYSMVIKLDPQFAYAYYQRGLGYGLIGETDNAISDLEKALQLGLEPDEEQHAQGALDELKQLVAGQIIFDGYWGGNTSQGEVITFEIEDNSIVSYSVGFQIPGCESLSPYYTFGGEPRGFVEGHRFSIDDNFASISGTFISISEAMGTMEIFCESGLTTSWTVTKGAQAVRIPSPADLAKIPQVEISDDLFSSEDGSDNFDEFTGVVASSGDWFLLRNYSESVISIPSGWTSVSSPDGAYYMFNKEGSIENPSVVVQVGRGCTEAESTEEFISELEVGLNSEPDIEILMTEFVDSQKGYFFLTSEQDTRSRYRLVLISEPPEGCYFYLGASTHHDEWGDYYPLIRIIVEHWFDLSNNFLGVSLPETLVE